MKCTWYRLLHRLCNLIILASFSKKPFDEVTDGYSQPISITKSCCLTSAPFLGPRFEAVGDLT